jgi:outer membrane lipoprotein carrier protein
MKILMKKILLAICTLCLSFSVSYAKSAEQKLLDQTLDQVQAAYDKAKSYKAIFVQKTGTRGSSKPKISEGTVSFHKPGKMRWDYTTPERLFVSNGKTFWMVQPDRKEAVKADAKKMFGDKTPAAFLSGFGKIRDEFEPELVLEDKKEIKLKLTLKKPTTQAQYLLVTIDRKTGLAKAVRTVDFFGAFNELQFKQYELNEKFEPAIFEYTPPKGYKVLNPMPKNQK